jgi:hypothetical protein
MVSLQVIFTVVFILWLFASLAVWWLNYQLSKKRFEQIDRVWADATMKSAEAARMSADAVNRLVKLMEEGQKPLP